MVCEVGEGNLVEKGAQKTGGRDEQSQELQRQSQGDRGRVQPTRGIGRRSGAPLDWASGPLCLWVAMQFMTKIMAIIGPRKGTCRGV